MKKGVFIKALIIILVLALGFSLDGGVMAQENNKKTPKPEKTARPETIDTKKLVKVIDEISRIRVYIEFFFMESGDYPADLSMLEGELNGLLPPGIEKIVIPKDPATGKEFIYTMKDNGKSYTLEVPDPKKYGVSSLELSNVDWGGFARIAEERKQKFLQMICIENIKTIATAVEYYAKDHQGKFPVLLKDLIPSYLKTMPVCPASNELFVYKVDGDNYLIRVPDPKSYGMNELMFSSERGWVTR
ncbi:MAG: hypothetical protein ACLFQV_13655 [Vulcanimicrobiota bacterium]